jgi:hypothetical protein
LKKQTICQRNKIKGEENKAKNEKMKTAKLVGAFVHIAIKSLLIPVSVPSVPVPVPNPKLSVPPAAQ